LGYFGDFLVALWSQFFVVMMWREMKDSSVFVDDNFCGTKKM
jgi:hypothetical protein